MNRFARTCVVAGFTIAVATLPPRAARSAEFVDVTCPNATMPTRTFVALTHHLPQPLEQLLDASHAVAHEYEICAANFRSNFELENMNYALVQQARSNVWSATVEAKFGRPAAARRDVTRVLDETQIVTGYKDRAAETSSDASGAVMDLRHDSVPSRFDAQAKELTAQARSLLSTLGTASPSPGSSPEPIPSPIPAATR